MKYFINGTEVKKETFSEAHNLVEYSILAGANCEYDYKEENNSLVLNYRFITR